MNKILVWDNHLQMFIANLILKEGKTINNLPNPEKYQLIYIENE